MRSKRTVVIAAVAAVVAIPIAVAGAGRNDNSGITVIDPEEVEQRDRARAPERQAEGSEVPVPSTPLPGDIRIGPGVDPDDPPAMKTAVPVPANGIDGLSARVNTDPVADTETAIATRYRFDGDYELNGERYEVTVQEVSEKAKERELMLGTETKASGSGKVYVNEPAEAVVVLRKGSVVSIFGGRSVNDRLDFLRRLEVE